MRTASLRCGCATVKPLLGAFAPLPPPARGICVASRLMRGAAVNAGLLEDASTMSADNGAGCVGLGGCAARDCSGAAVAVGEVGAAALNVCLESCKGLCIIIALAQGARGLAQLERARARAAALLTSRSPRAPMQAPF